MKKRNTISSLSLLIIILFSCNQDEENNPVTMDENLISSINLNIASTTFEFEFDECNFSLTGNQRPLNSFGEFQLSSSTWNTKTLHCNMRNTEIELGIKTIYIEEQNPIDNTEINFVDIQSILQSNINDTSNKKFGFEVLLKYQGKSFVSTERNIDFDGSNNAFVYYPNFNFNIITDDQYESDCNEEDVIKIEGNFSGWLFSITNGQIADSIEVDMNQFEILLLN